MKRKLRHEGAIEDLEAAKKKAAAAGPAAMETFKEKSFEKSVEESKAMGTLTGGGSTSSGSDDFSSDSGDDSDSGDSGSGSDDFSFDEDSSDTVTEDETVESESTEETTNEDSGDSEDKDAEPPAEEPSEEEKVKTEACRNVDFLKELPSNLRMESFFGSTMQGSGSFIGDVAGFVVAGLAAVGLRLTPAILSGMYKVVIWTFAQCFSALDTLFDAASERLERYLNRTERLQEQLKALQNELDEKTKQGYRLQEAVELDTDVSYLRGSSPDLTQNLGKFNDDLRTQMKRFQQSILNDLGSLEFIAKSRYLQREFDAMQFMKVKPEALGLERYGHDGGEESLVDVYHSNVMIGGVMLVVRLPMEHLDTWDNFEKAYKQSRISLSGEYVQASPDTKVMALDENNLRSFLNNLDLLIEASVQQKQLYESILHKRAGTLNSIKSLFIKLANEVTKTSFKNSVALPLQLKSQFVTKVYMVGAMDLQDHTARVIANGLSFAADVLKTYRKQA